MPMYPPGPASLPGEPSIDAIVDKEIDTIIAPSGFGSSLDMRKFSDKLEKIYKMDDNTILQKWYQPAPYAFQYTDPDGKMYVINLPINPSNINITTHFSTNVISTLYSVVEEHSKIKFYDIVIEGTTGMVPKFVGLAHVVDKAVFNQNEANGRQTETADSLIPSDIAGGFMAKQIATVNAAVSGIADVFNKILDGNNRKSGVYLDQTGFYAFHYLYRFFLQYKRETASAKEKNKKYKGPPLTFISYKDSVKYNVVPVVFNFSRAAEDPMLYKYSIQMRAYNIKSLGKVDEEDWLSRRFLKMGIGGGNTTDAFSNASAVTNAVTNTLGAFGVGF